MKYSKIYLGFTASKSPVPRSYLVTLRREELERIYPGGCEELEVSKILPKTEWSPGCLYHVLRKSVSVTKSSDVGRAFITCRHEVLRIHIGDIYTDDTPYEVVKAMFDRPRNHRHPQV